MLMLFSPPVVQDNSVEATPHIVGLYSRGQYYTNVQSPQVESGNREGIIKCIDSYGLSWLVKAMHAAMHDPNLSHPIAGYLTLC